MRKNINLNSTGGNTYRTIERILWLLNAESFYFDKYMEKFNISRRTAFRDFSFINNYKFYKIVMKNNYCEVLNNEKKNKLR